MSADKEQEPGRKDDKEKKKSFIDVLAAKFKELVEEIKRLLGKKEQKGLNEEEVAYLKKYEQERNKRIQRFYKTPFGKEISVFKKQINGEIEEAIKQIKQVSEDGLKEEAEKAENLLNKLIKKAIIKWEEEGEKGVDTSLKGVAEHELMGLITKKNKRLEQALVERSGKRGAEASSEHQRTKEEIEKRKKLAEAIAEISREAEQKIIGDDPEVKSRGLNDFSKAQAMMRAFADGAGERFSPYELSKEDKDAIKKGGKEREKVFLGILSGFGIDEDRDFRQTDITTQSKWIDFMKTLDAVEQKALKRYTLRFGFEEATHNLRYFLNGHAPIADIPKVISHFQSKMMDVACREKGAVAAFRAYEQAFDQMMLFDGKISPEKFWDPDTEKQWVHEWVAGQVRKTLTADIQKQRGGISWEEAESEYLKENADFEKTFIDTGFKIFIFSLRGDEIQASSPRTRETSHAWSPWHEDMGRRLDPMAIPLRYWGGRLGVEEFVGRKEGTALTTFWYFNTGEEAKKFETLAQYKKAMKKIDREGEDQLNLFDIGGILSVSPWRSTGAFEYLMKINPELARFLGIEMECKKLKHQYSEEYSEGLSGKQKEAAKRKGEYNGKREALAHGRIRNPFRLFLLAEEDEQNKILEKYDVDEKDKNAFLKSIYDDMSQALQRRVYGQQEQIKNILQLPETKRNQELAEFIKREKNKGLDFGFIQNADQKDRLEKFVKTIQNHFKTPELDKDGHWIKGKKGNEAFEKLVEKRFPFSMGTDDVPMELFRFTDLGDVALQRRFRDVGGAAKAAEAFWKLNQNLGTVLQKDDNIIAALQEIYHAIGEYGPGIASDKMLMLTDRIIKMVKQDAGQAWLPWPLCELRDKWGFTSKAEKLFGQNHMSLDKEETRLLVEKLIGAGLFTGEDAKNARKQFYKKYRLGRGWVLKDKAWRYGPMVSVGIVAAGIAILIKGVKEDIEQTAKEA